jgi:hypothetical protein
VSNILSVAQQALIIVSNILSVAQQALMGAQKPR